MDALIEHMKACGWTQEDGYVAHPLGMQLPDWVEAICACIEVASEA